MEQQNIIIRDIKTIFEYVKSFGKWLINECPFLYRWLASWVIGVVLIKGFGIQEYSVWGLNITFLLSGISIYFLGYLFHKSYNFNEYFKRIVQKNKEDVNKIKDKMKETQKLIEETKKKIMVIKDET